MDETEKMTALKKAYAETILNTAKEAAARIMESERKAHQFHHDLSSTKEEAIRLLLRLKQTMDSKLNEAEMKSQNQQRRIEELEAQLQEAEDIVGNLRAKLNEVHMRLEEMGKIQMQNPRTEPENELPEAVLPSQVTGLSNAAKVHCSANNSVEEYGYSGVPDVPPIIERSKKPELYRNGCTQRIHAYEGNLLNGHFSLSGEIDDLKNEKTISEDKEDERKSDITCILGKKLLDIKKVKNVDKSSCKAQAFESFRKKRKRGARYRSSASVFVLVPPVAKETLSNLSESHDMLESFSSENKDKQSLSPSLAPSNVSEMGAPSKHVAVAQGDEDREVASSLVLIRQQSGSGVCLDVPSSNSELEMKNVSCTNLNAKVSDIVDGFPSLPPKDRVLKYTFQRKRKKEALSSDDGSLLPQEEMPSKQKTGKKQNGSLEPPKSSAVAESSRDSRRMAQVARQLISLSEKKWWK